MPQIIKVGYGWSQTQFTSSIAYSNTLEARYGESHGSPYVQIATDCGTDWVSGFNISVAYRTIPKGTTGGWGSWSGFYWSGVKASECWHGTEAYSSRHLWSFPLGNVGLTPTGSDPGPSIGSLVCMLVYTAGFAMSWGPVCWVLLAEIFPNSVRSTVMSIAVASQWIANFLVSWSFPMLDKSAFLTERFNHGMAYWLYGLMGLLAAWFIWRMIPETKGKTLEEMERYWK